MVDTIIFRIHDLQRHDKLLNFLSDMATGGSIKRRKYGSEPYEPKKDYFIKDYYKDVATGREIEVGQKLTFESSYHYDAVYFVRKEPEPGYIEINFSMPKYWFGNNIAQLVDHYQDTDYFHVRNNDFWDCKKQAFKRFAQVLNHFIATNLGGEMKEGSGMVDKKLVEIARIDLCYNQCFANREDALLYLDELRSIRKKGMQKIAGKALDYDGAVYFPSSNVTLKIYHKGKEFQKHDYRKIAKRYGKETSNRLLRTADCMLRFEVEFRKGGLTDAYFTYLRQIKHPVYSNIRIARAVSAHGYYTKGDLRYNFDGLRNKKEDPTFRAMDYAQRKQLQIGQKIIGNNIRFFARATMGYSLLDLQNEDILKNYTHQEVFDEGMFNVLVDRFKVMVQHFRLGDLSQLKFISDALKAAKTEAEFQRSIYVVKGFNIAKAGISPTTLAMLLGYLREYSWKEIEDKNLMKRTTLYRYKKWLAALGLGEKNTQNGFNITYKYDHYFDFFMADFYTVCRRFSFYAG